jgi:hypothetical protein
MIWQVRCPVDRSSDENKKAAWAAFLFDVFVGEPAI